MTEPLSRRTFLQQSAVAGAAALAVGTAPRARGDDKNDSIRVAVLGTNGRGIGLVKEFAGVSGVEIAYICDPDTDAIAKGLAAASAAGQQRLPEGIQDFRRALDDKDLDALVIATPDHWHAPAAILGCSAGKHVYVEKPASHNLAEGEWMIQAARKHDRKAQLGTQRRSLPGIQEAIKRVHAGDIGRVLMARGWINSTRPTIGRGRQAPVPKNLDYAIWQGPAPEVPYRDNVIHYHWHWFWHWGTGELGNNGIHALDVCRWGLGVDYPQQVVCAGGKFHFDDDQQTPDTQIATFHFGDKLINWEHRTWNRRGFEGESFGIAFYGESGSLVITNQDYRLFDLAARQTERVPLARLSNQHAENFCSAIRTGTALNAEIEEGVKSTALCHLGNIAYRTGRTVRFDPDKREILGDTEQRSLAARQYREGWQPKV